MAKGCGIALILIGVISAVDMFTTGLVFKIAYIVVLLIIIIGLLYFLRVNVRNKRSYEHITFGRRANNSVVVHI